TGAVPDAERGLADEARNPLSLHRAQQVTSALRKDARRTEVPLMAQSGNDRILPAHRSLHRSVVEHISLKDLQALMRHPKLCWSSRQDRHHVPAFQCLRD